MKNVIIIGSGFASLSAASVLAKAGCAVTVLEKNATLGGRARMLNVEGLRFDMGPSWYWMPDVFEAFFNFFGKSASDYYQLVKLEPSFKMFFARDEVLEIPSSPAALEDLFESIESGAGAQLRRFLIEAAYKYEVGMRSLIYKPGQSLLEFADIRLLTSVFRLHLFRSFHRHVRKFFQNDKLLRLMEFPILFLGATPRNTPALYSLMNYAGLSLGTWYPMGGMHKIIAALVTLAESLGVKFKTATPATEIAVHGGCAVGVRSNGALHEGEAIIAGADYHHVEQHLLAPEHRTYDERYWQARTMAPSSLIFYLGVRGKIPNLAHHNLFFDADYEQHAREIYDKPQWPERPLFYVCCPSITDPEVAPENAENLFLLVPIAAGLPDTAALRERYFDLIMNRLEHFTGVSIKSRIFCKKSYCIADFARDYNAFKGNAYGLANTLRQTAILKPSMKSRKVANLFYAGQLTVPGPGVPPSLISGQIAAKETLEYLNQH